jgi:protein SCO1/2
MFTVNSPAGKKDVVNIYPTLVAIISVLIIGVAAIFNVTGGFRLISTEEARRAAIAANPRKIPDLKFHYADGKQHMLSEALKNDGRITIVSFIYTRCNEVCSILGNEFQQLQQTIEMLDLKKKVRLVSISFDQNDHVQELSQYAIRMHANMDSWEFVHVDTPKDLHALLNCFGIVVVPDRLGGFQHNAALHIVTPDGHLTRIFDFDRPNQALAFSRSLAEKSTALDYPVAGDGGQL